MRPACTTDHSPIPPYLLFGSFGLSGALMQLASSWLSVGFLDTTESLKFRGGGMREA
jgi:hypothetical protein